MTTKLQQAMLAKIALSEYTPANGSEPETNDDVGQVWADCIIEDAEDKGVFTSLLNAGLVKHEGQGRDACVYLTDAGFAEYKKISAARA